MIRTGIRSALGLLLACAFLVAPSPSASAVRPVAAAAIDATSVSKEAVKLRSDVAARMQTYIDQYGDRFSASELATLASLRGDADRKLADVVSATNALKEVTIRRGTSTQVRAAADRAIGAWARAKAAADTSWAKAGAIMEPKLGIFEKLGALNDYNAMMDRFDTLGTHIKSLRR